MKIIALGIAQGLTEFLPISSSGHLYLLERLFPIQTNYLSFVVFLHLATLLAICLFLFKKLKLLLDLRILFHIGIITLISGSMGLGIKFYFENFFANKYLLTFCFLINSGILLSLRIPSNPRTLKSLNLKDSLLIGILQGFSPFPGISRSGITIVGLLRRGFAKEEAFELSFLMAIPLMLGAFIVEFKGLGLSNLSLQNMALGFLSAFLAGLLALAIVKKALIVNKFKNFAYYCLSISLINLIL